MQAAIPAPIAEHATGPTTLPPTSTGTAFIASSQGGWMCNSPWARARARRPLNQLSINAACQAGGDIAWANLATACISNTYHQGLSADEKLNLVAGEDPLSYAEAMSCADAEKWKLAMLEEWQAILRNKTFQAFQEQEHPTEAMKTVNPNEFESLTPLEIPGHIKSIGSKWVYKTKLNPNGTTRYKVCLVIRGFQQAPGVDFGETYAPVSKLSTFRFLLALAARNGWQIDHLDVVTAFLNPEIDRETVFMTLPLGMDWVDPRFSAIHVVRLRKALYGLRQAPLLWYKEIHQFLLSIGFSQSTVDSNLYFGKGILLLLYVDDILLINTHKNSVDTLNQIKQTLQARYRMTNLGRARRFLGIQITQSHPANGIHIDQEAYILTILKRFRMSSAKDGLSPMDPNVNINNNQCEDKPANTQLYLSMVGSLMYAAMGTRPDLAFYVAALSRHNQKPLQMHLTAAKRALRYLKHTATFGLYYARQSDQDNGPPIGFTDSDWAGNQATRKSTGGYIFFGSGHVTSETKASGSGAVSWQAKSQSVVALSTLEAEYIACSDATREALWLRRLYQETTQQSAPYQPSISRPIPIACDNQGAILLIKTGITKQKTKHIAVKYHHSHDEQLQGNVLFTYIPTEINVADVLTKPLPTLRHQYLTNLLGLRAITQHPLEEEGVC